MVEYGVFSNYVSSDHSTQQSVCKQYPQKQTRHNVQVNKFKTFDYADYDDI